MGQINSYVETYETLTEVLDLYDSYKDKGSKETEQFFLYLNDEMGISHWKLTCLYDNLRNYIGMIDKLGNEEDSMITLINGIRIIIREYDSFYKKHFSCDPYKCISNNNSEKMFSMFDLIDGYMNDRNNFYSLIYNMVKKENILYEDLKAYAEYVNGYCYNYNTSRITHFRMKSVYNFREMYDLYRKILSDPKFIVDICSGTNERFISFVCYVKAVNGVTPNILNKSLSKFKNDENVKNFINKYNKHYSKYENKKNNQKCMEHFEYAYGMIKNYLDGEYKDLHDYCDKIGTTVSTFQKYVGLMKKSNNSIYNEYVEFDNVKKQAELEYKHNCIDALLSGIRNGVNENGVIREFDLLDYYSYTNIPFKELKKVACKYLNSCDLLTLSLFVSKYGNDKIIDNNSINSIFDTKDILFCEFDNNGNMINPGYEVTTDDKKQILTLLNEKNIPLTVKTYSLMRDRYIQNEILEKHNKNTIKR